MLYLNKVVLRKQKNSAELASKVDTDEEGIYDLEDKSKEIIKKGRGYSSVVEHSCPEVIRNATQEESAQK